MPDSAIFIAPDPAKHHDEMFDMIAKVFSRGHGYFDGLDWLRGGYIDNSHYDWNASRIGILDGKIVSHYGVWEYQMRIGSARVRVGGIGVVATHGQYRKRGLMDRTAAASIEAMRELGYDMTILFGIDDFYHRFGYTRAWNEVDYNVKTADLPGDAPRQAVRQLPLEQRHRFGTLFNEYNATITGSAVRPTYSRAARHEAKWELHTWGKAGSAGYVIVADQGNRMNVMEAVGESEQVLRAVRQLAARMGADDVRFVFLPPTCPLARALRRLNCSVETRHRKCGQAMIRTLNLVTTLQKMSGELGKRLKQSPLADWKAEVAIADGRESVVVTIDHSRINVTAGKTASSSIRGGDEIAQLLIGAEDPAEIAAVHGTKLAGQAKMLLPILFPNQHPMLHMADRY